MGNNESVVFAGTLLSERQIQVMFRVLGLKNLNEGAWDDIKAGAGKIAGAVKDKATTVGHNLTTKVTADKLNKAWEKAGKPTDSEAVRQVLQSTGVPDDVINQTFQQLGIDVQQQAPADDQGRVEPTMDPQQALQQQAQQAPPQQQAQQSPVQQQAPAPQQAQQAAPTIGLPEIMAALKTMSADDKKKLYKRLSGDASVREATQY